MIAFSGVIPVYPDAAFQSAPSDWNKNRLDNGNFDVWQMGPTSSVATGATAYGPDRWQVQNLTGVSIAVAQAPAPRGFSGVKTLSLSATGVTTSAPWIVLLQKFRSQSVQDLEDQVAALSFDCLASTSAGNLSGYVQIVTNLTLDDATFAFQSPQLPFTIPVGAGRVRVGLSAAMTAGLANGGYVAIGFQQLNATGNVSVQIGAVQLEKGEVANAFSVRPPGVEMNACMRDLFVGPSVKYSATATAANKNHFFVPLARMWGTPTVTIASGGTATAGFIFDANASADVAAAVETTTRDGFGVFCTGTVSAVGAALNFTYTADCRL